MHLHRDYFLCKIHHTGALLCFGEIPRKGNLDTTVQELSSWNLELFSTLREFSVGFVSKVIDRYTGERMHIHKLA